MPELRRDPVVGRWVIVAAERAKRPQDFLSLANASKNVGREVCPFCPGQEDKTPPEILAYRPAGSAPDGPGWTLRVVPNKYPALQIEGELDPRPPPSSGEPLRALGHREEGEREEKGRQEPCMPHHPRCLPAGGAQVTALSFAVLVSCGFLPVPLAYPVSGRRSTISRRGP